MDKVRTGKLRQINARFSALASHYLFEPEFCTPASGWEKGQIEKNVQDSRRRFWLDLPSFADLNELNDWLERRCVEEWGRIAHGALPGTIAEVQALERPSLMPMGRPFDGFIAHSKRVSPTCLIHFERNRYSVPASFANLPVMLQVYPDRLVVLAEGQVVCEHPRVVGRTHGVGRTIYDWRHYLAVLQRKPGALRNGAPFAEMPEVFRRLQAVLLRREGGDKEMVEVLSLVLLHDEDAVICAVALALEAQAPSKAHILNLLHRLVDGAGAEAAGRIEAPEGLALRQEPKADPDRYDALRPRGEDRHAS